MGRKPPATRSRDSQKMHLAVLIMLLYVTLARVPTRDAADSEPMATLTPAT